MTFEAQIEFLNLEPSEFVERAVRQRLRKLERFSAEIMRCRVTVEAPHKHHGKGNLYHVAIDLSLRGAEILANRDPSRNHAHEDVYVAIRDAVNAASRQLQDHVRVRRGKTKSHAPPPHGHVVELNPAQDYGRIETAEGRLIYFHRNSLLGAELESLAIGAEVRFDEEQGNDGPQASSVRLVGRHHLVP